MGVKSTTIRDIRVEDLEAIKREAAREKRSMNNQFLMMIEEYAAKIRTQEAGEKKQE